MSVIEIIILVVVLAFLFLFLFPTYIMSSIIYTVLLVRTKPEKWARECSIPDDEEYKRMFDIGLDWNEEYKNYKQEVAIDSEGFHLVGEYFDFGNDKAVIIIPGRMESLLYSYFFAEPYRKAGYNILCIDNRCHGLSEGKYSALGFKEYKDILNWGKELHDNHNIKSIVIHGICIGANTGLFAMTDENCPDYFSGLVSEGMYKRFYDSFINHMIEDKRPIFPIALFTMAHIRIYSGAKPMSGGPYKCLDKMTKPVLFLHSREDTFSTPETSGELYKMCKAPNKIVWFNKGSHSRIRINDFEGYDNEIIDFLNNMVKCN